MVACLNVLVVLSFGLSLIIAISAFYFILKILSKHITNDQRFDEL